MILLCYDGSADAEHAIRRAGELLAAREAVVLSVAVPAAEEIPLDPLGDLVGRASGVYRQWDEIAAELAERNAARGCEIAAEAGIAATPLTASGRVAPAILVAARERDVSVIVMGRGRSGIIGSVSAHVMHDADRPVLSIPTR